METMQGLGMGLEMMRASGLELATMLAPERVCSMPAAQYRNRLHHRSRLEVLRQLLK